MSLTNKLSEEELNAPVVKSTVLTLNPKKRRRKPVIPNKNGIDRITIISQTDRYVDITARFLYKDPSSFKDVSVRLHLPARNRIRERFKKRNPKMSEHKLDENSDEWLQQFISMKLKRLWRRNRPATKELTINQDIEGLT